MESMKSISIISLTSCAVALCFLCCTCGNNNGHTRVVTPQQAEELIEETPEPVFDGIDSVVNLSFLNFAIGNKASGLNAAKNTFQTTVTEDAAKECSLTRNLVLSGKSYPVELTVSVVNDTICSVYGQLKSDIYSSLFETIKAKYGKPSSGGDWKNTCWAQWKFRNQTISIHREQPQRVIYHPELKKDIYTNFFDFKYVSVAYSDVELCDRFSALKSVQKEYDAKQQAIRDSIDAIRAIEAQKVAEQERNKRLLQDAAQL